MSEGPQTLTQRRAQEPFDVDNLDPAAKRAFQYAIDFYEKDHLLTPNQRSLLANSYSTISTVTLCCGWATFFAVTAIPFQRQKLRTGSTKGTNVGLAMLFGMGGMMFSSPFAAQKAYNWQLEKLRNSDEKCYEVANLLKPSESTKWWMYYKLTKDHPEHIMKDPRSKEAEEQRKKTIYSGRDPMGLYSGPRAEMNKRQAGIPDADKVGGGVTGIASGSSIPEFDGSDNVNDDDDDPFIERDVKEPSYSSAWDRVRHSNGVDDNPQSGSSWGRLRSSASQQPQAPQNPFTTNVYRPPAKETQSDETSDFEKLLEKERHFGEEEDKKW
ncbi:hypothetical protein BON22_1865 [Cyberlindnera fabianii]|uniref:Uncharacterized protein n=1 Tax=Cyberlindnera fabianii TaxID=36022 RepID=A0A1V2L8B2_CYBFA|nr:hypothetical protein BON22_1865 [Cyberlindnera fabianii]